MNVGGQTVEQEQARLGIAKGQSILKSLGYEQTDVIGALQDFEELKTKIPTLDEVKEKLLTKYLHATYEDCIKSVYWIMRTYIEKG